jgi:type II secretion system protein J
VTPSGGGFTLLELLLAVAVSGVLAAGLFGGLAVVFNARDTAERQVQGQAELQIAGRLLRDQLAATLRPTGAGTLIEPFRGTSATTRDGRPADTLTFVTASLAVPTGVERGDLHEVELALVEVNNADDAARGPYHLVQRVTDELVRGGDTSFAEPITQTLLRGVAGLGLRYHDGNDWVDTWDESERRNELPLAVELTIERAQADENGTASSDDAPRLLRQVIPLPTSLLEPATF